MGNQRSHCWNLLQRVAAISLLTAAASVVAPAAEDIPVHVRAYDLGIAYMPASRGMPVEKAYDLIAGAADLAYIQGSWNDWQKGTLAKDTALARARKLKTYVALDLLGYVPHARQTLTLPNGKTADFTNSAARLQYTDLVKRIAREYTPDYFNLLVEVNMHKKSNGPSFEAFKALYPQLCAAVKTISPRTKVCVSISYDADPAHKTTFDEDAADFEAYNDVFAVSTYPHCFANPSNVPLDFLGTIAGYSKKPLFISETSWVNHSFTINMPDGKFIDFSSSPDDQAAYVVKLAQSAKLAQEQKKPIAAINFVALCDPPPATVKAITDISLDLEWFCHLGFSDPSGAAKPAYDALKKWRGLKRE